jgi:hypothetical protein
MDTIQDIALQFGLTDILITPAVVKKVFENTSNHKGLQRFCIYLMVILHCYLLRLLDNDDPEEIEDADPNDHKVLKQKDIGDVWQMSRENFEIFRRFQNRLANRIQGPVDKQSYENADPRKRIEECISDRYFFHCHEEDYNCRHH